MDQKPSTPVWGTWTDDSAWEPWQSANTEPTPAPSRWQAKCPRPESAPQRQQDSAAAATSTAAVGQTAPVEAQGSAAAPEGSEETDDSGQPVCRA